MAKGWIKLHRKIEENCLYSAEPFDKLHAWLDLLIHANAKPTSSFYVDGQLVTLKQGEIYTSETKLAERWKWSRGKVHRFLSTLEIQEMCTVKRTAGGTANGTTITLINWAFYQGGGTANDTAVSTANSTAHSTAVGHIQELIKNNKEEKKGDPQFSENSEPDPYATDDAGILRFLEAEEAKGRWNG